MSFTCHNCGITADRADKLCSATQDGPEDPFCGIPEEWVCRSMLPNMKYTCESCGSVSATANNLCRPTDK